MPLNTKYRPESLDQFVGNRVTINSLKSILANEDRPHCFLFHGPTGCGKTTLARIVAKELGCGITDLIEVNASNNRGIDTAREIISTMRFKPTSGNVRMFILDEVHQTTKDFQNALLKAMEDTPPHVYFALCTTEPDRLLSTVVNRCASFPVSNLPPRQLRKILERVLEAEGVGIPGETVQEICTKSDGCPRRALVSLEQIVDIPEEEMAEALKVIERRRRQAIDLYKALFAPECSWEKISEILRNLDQEPETVRRGALTWFNKVLLSNKGIKAKRAALIIEYLRENLFSSGKAGLTVACFHISNSGK